MSFWSFEANRFSKLVNELTAEHTRVVNERDRLRQMCARCGVDTSGARGSRGLDSVFQLCVQEENGSLQAVETLPTPVLNTSSSFSRPCTPSKDSTGLMRSTLSFTNEPIRPDKPPPLGDIDDEYDGSPGTPRALRVFRGDAQLPQEDLISECGKTQPTQGTKLELHTRWLDLYVANQLKGDAFGSADERRRSSSQLGQLLRLAQEQVLDPDSDSNRMCWLRQAMDANVPLLPGTKMRVAWDIVGSAIIFYDVLTIPVQLAWELDPNLNLIRIMLVYWVIDMVLQFSSAYTSQGQIVAKRSSVTLRYLQCRFWLDLFLVLLDIMVLANPSNFGDVGWYRAFRAFRVLRMLRAFKLGAMQETMEDFFMDTGVERMLLAFAISQTLISMFFISHMFTCGWYYLGRMELSNGQPSWITFLVEDSGTDESSLLDAYLFSMYWTLGNLLNGNVNPAITPVTFAERAFTVSMIAVSLVVIGAGISKMTNTIADLQRVNVEAKDTRRKLSIVLRASGADADLSARILRFGMHLFRRKASLSLEDSVMGLLSHALAGELTLSQRSRYLSEHPLFELIRTDFSDVYMQLCGAFNSHIYADSDTIFQEGTVGECLYITLRGEYVLETSLPFLYRFPLDEGSTAPGNHEFDPKGQPKPVKFSGLRWLCEIALFTNMVHKSRLRTKSFADAFTLRGEDFAVCVERSPRCITKVYHYATEFIAQLERMPCVLPADGAEGLDDFDYELVPVTFSQRICEQLKQNVHGTEITSHNLDSPLHDIEHVKSFMDRIMSGECTSADDLMDEIPEVFTELNTPSGIYEGLKMEPERKRSLAAMVSVIWLVQGDYDSFTAAQTNARTRLSRELWMDMQRFVRWADVSKELLRSVLVFLAIRGIGKAAPFLQAMHRDCRTAEDVVLTLMHQLPRKVPSFDACDDAQKTLIESALNIHRGFNFAQMLQAENAPYHVAVLQRMAQMEGDQVLKLYLLSLVGVMCGLRGAENPRGSLFMDQVNGATLMAGIRMIEKLSTLSANAIYWGYVGEKARMLSLPFRQLEDLVVARLACLTRAKASDIGALQVEWYRLNRTDREAFMEHFLGDGLYKATYIFTFLPAYLANARANKNVGLYRALVVLVELIDTLTGDGYLDKGERIVTVSLQDLAEFTQKVESSGAFMAVHVHSSIVSRHNRLEFIVSAKHKQSTSHQNWSDDPTHEMRALMRRMDRRVGCVNKELEKLWQERSPKAASSDYGMPSELIEAGFLVSPGGAGKPR